MSTSEKSNLRDLYKGLRALAESSFPKKCMSCGKQFETVESFLSETHSLRNHSGLKPSYDDDENPIVELFRNCSCGSTLMDSFSDRRDVSENGIKRRELFGKLLLILENNGISKIAGRNEILKMMRGEKSEQLEEMGIRMKSL